MKTLKMNIGKLLLIATLLLLSVMIANAQTVKPTDKVLKDTVIKSITYKMYVGSRGGKYVLRTAKSGNVYKMYIKH